MAAYLMFSRYETLTYLHGLHLVVWVSLLLTLGGSMCLFRLLRQTNFTQDDLYIEPGPPEFDMYLRNDG